MSIPGVPNLPYFTPQHPISPGTPIPNGNGESEPIPTLFTPLTIRGKTLRNRIIVSPMCQYSCASQGPQIGALTDYHIATLGHYALKGAALVLVEATGVQANGRISPNCPGLWNDDQIPALKRVSDFVKSQGALSGIQLAHAGRKASTAAIRLAISASGGKRFDMRAPADEGGWPDNVVGPMGGDAHTWDGKPSTDPESGFYAPRALSEKDIEELVQDWAAAAKRAVQAGIDVIEIHAAHGYLINEFMSPVTNQRTDRYGGSFENRIRLLVEIIQAIRVVVPESMPLFVRISATEWLEGTEISKKHTPWTVEESIQLAKLLPAIGADLLDCSSGGNHPTQTVQFFEGQDYQTRIAGQIRAEVKQKGVKLLIGAVGRITEAEQARDIVDGGVNSLNANEGKDEIGDEAKAALKVVDAQNGNEPMGDVILVARQFLREPEWVLRVAHKLKVNVAWPSQSLMINFGKM